MFKDFCNWASAVVTDGRKKECVFEFKMQLIDALLDGNISRKEYNILLDTVND